MPRTRNGAPVEAKKAAAKRAASAKKPTQRHAPPKGATAKPPDETPPKNVNEPQRPGKRLTMVERLRIAERVVVARAKAKPDTWKVIEQREKVPIRTLQSILAQYQDEMGKLGDASGAPILQETLLLYTASIEKLAWEAEYGDNTASRVGATRSLLDAAKGRIELLAVMGRMPRSFRAMDELAALQRFVRRLAEIVERHELPPEVVHEFVALADEIQPVIEGTAQRALPSAA